MAQIATHTYPIFFFVFWKPANVLFRYTQQEKRKKNQVSNSDLERGAFD